MSSNIFLYPENDLSSWSSSYFWDYRKGLILYKAQGTQGFVHSS